jgi:hypothetical protein
MYDEVEDILQEKGVFYNGLRGEDHHAHMDSYMTCINWTIFEKVWSELADKYTKNQWLGLVKYWEAHSYCSPNCGILAATIKRKIQ